LSVEASFLDTLTDSELEAAVAHELGHVWIFTHHPFLQTEELANKIAMRAVTRETLQRVYAKVWERSGTKGDLAWFLGDVPSSGSTAGLATDTTR
jgi:predicted Zn-dependent protease